VDGKEATEQHGAEVERIMNVQDNGSVKSTPAPGSQAAPLAQGTETLRTSIFLPGLMPGADQGPPLPAALSAAPTAYTLWRAFLRVWPRAVLMGAALAIIAVAMVYFLMPPKYPVMFMEKVESAKFLPVVGGVLEDVEYGMFKSWQLELVKSREVINRALETQVNGRFVKDLPLVREQSDAVGWLQGMKAEPHLKSPEIIVVSFATRTRPEDLTLLMNALARSLVEENRIREMTKHNDLIEQTQGKERELSKQVDLKRKLLGELTRGIADGNAQLKMLDRLEQQLRDRTNTRDAKRLEILGVENRIKGVKERIANPTLTGVPPDVVNDLLKGDLAVQPFIQRIAKTTADLSEVKRVAPNNLSAIQEALDRKIDAERSFEEFKQQNRPQIEELYRRKIVSEGAEDLRRLESELSGLKEQEHHVDLEVTRLEGEIRQIRPQVALPPNVIALRNEIESLEKAQSEVQQKIAQMKVNVPKSKVSIYQDAIEPSAPDYSRFTKLAGAGGIGAFLFAVLAFSFNEFRSRKICSSDEVSRGLGLPLLGTVPALPAKARNPVAGQKADAFWQSQMMESIDTIRTLLMHNARSNNTRVVMVTSAFAGEGKTSLASQLAASLARAWKKTLLIDGDLRSPALHRLFEVPQEPGLSEVLRGELSASEAVRSTPLSRLWVLSAGQWDSHAVQALAQDNVRTILEELKQHYDFIILDSSPVLPVADALLLGQNVDGVLLTVMRDLSRTPALYAAEQRLQGLGIKTLGAVMIGAKNDLGPVSYKYAAQARN
jgi:capsular exopolysaccharide synthesis family protein